MPEHSYEFTSEAAVVPVRDRRPAWGCSVRHEFGMSSALVGHRACEGTRLRPRCRALKDARARQRLE